MNSFLKTAGRWVIPLSFFATGVHFVFSRFLLSGGESIHGDLGDARFNLIVVEHLRQWWNGSHASLFDLPMFAPHTQVYSYSDLWFTLAPLYLLFLWIGKTFSISSMDFYGAWEWTQIGVSALNYFLFYFFVVRFLETSNWSRPHEGSERLALKNKFIAGLVAFCFSFGLTRQAHLNHIQLWPQFWIVISAWGLFEWCRRPSSRLAPALWIGGAALQFLTAIYYFWFWIWTLSMALLVLWVRRESRLRFWNTIQVTQPWKNKGVWMAMAGGLALTAPFLVSYLFSAAEMGRHPWVSISNTVPRLYSWIYVPETHWQWPLVVFKKWISELPMPHEHQIGMGLGTTALIIWAWFEVRLSVQKIPHSLHALWLRLSGSVLLLVFLFTLTSGRFSTWVLMSYFFPGGGVIRSVGRIQIFMLMLWMLLLAWGLAKQRLRYSILAAIVLVTEAWWPHAPHFSRSESEARIQQLMERVPTDCRVLVYEPGFRVGGERANVDAVLAAWRLGIATANGYSGRQPKGFLEILQDRPEKINGQKTCFIPERI